MYRLTVLPMNNYNCICPDHL